VKIILDTKDRLKNNLDNYEIDAVRLRLIVVEVIFERFLNVIASGIFFPSGPTLLDVSGHQGIIVLKPRQFLDKYL